MYFPISYKEKGKYKNNIEFRNINKFYLFAFFY